MQGRVEGARKRFREERGGIAGDTDGLNHDHRRIKRGERIMPHSPVRELDDDADLHRSDGDEMVQGRRKSAFDGGSIVLEDDIESRKTFEGDFRLQKVLGIDARPDGSAAGDVGKILDETVNVGHT